MTVIHPRRAWPVCLAAMSLFGCAGYAGAVAEMRTALQAGDKPRALEKVDKALDVKGPDELPDKVKGDKALLLLERAMIKQGLNQPKSSAGDFRVADKHLELLDLKNDTMGNIGKFIFSDDATVYKAPAYEKLLLNTFNMLNYLSLGDVEGAKVEARRLRVMQKYLSDEESEQASLLGLGSYLAGFAFEMSGQREQAMSFYADAVADGGYPSLVEPLSRLRACTSFKDERIDKFLEGRTDATCEGVPEGKGTILVVSGCGLVPHKVPKRIPIGAAVVLAGAFLTNGQILEAQGFAAHGLLTWINFPHLQPTPLKFSRTRTLVDGREAETELGLNVTEKVLAAWESIKGKLMAAAIVRLITRLAAGVATEKAVSKASGSSIGGLLAGLAVQGTLTAMDTPDTRSWVTLPSAVYFSRVEVPAGTHAISIVFEGNGGTYTEKRSVTVPDGGFAVVPASAMR
jgi:uncharacterized protein